MRRWLPFVTAVLALSALVAGCGSDDSSSGASDTKVPFDQAFIDAMVPHHESAISMANEAIDAGLSEPELLLVTDAVLATQPREVDQMKAWRGAWFGSSEIDPEGAQALGMSTDEMGMSHSSESFDDSTDLGGAFAEAMITHHRGAIAMAELALDRAEHPKLRKLAEGIIETQTAEIERMEQYATGDAAHENMEGM